MSCSCCAKSPQMAISTGLLSSRSDGIGPSNGIQKSENRNRRQGTKLRRGKEFQAGDMIRGIPREYMDPIQIAAMHAFRTAEFRLRIVGPVHNRSLVHCESDGVPRYFNPNR